MLSPALRSAEMDRKFEYLEHALHCGVVHFNLEAVTVAKDAGHINVQQRGAAPELEARRDIPDS